MQNLCATAPKMGQEHLFFQCHSHTSKTLGCKAGGDGASLVFLICFSQYGISALQGIWCEDY